MKIRQLADAAIVAALLMASIPDLDVDLTPDALLIPAVCQHATEAEPDAPPENPASHRLC